MALALVGVCTGEGFNQGRQGNSKDCGDGHSVSCLRIGTEKFFQEPEPPPGKLQPNELEVGVMLVMSVFSE